MEEDIKILEDEEKYFNYPRERVDKAIENLIKGYRELEYKYNKALTDLSIEAKRTNEENYRCSLFAVENNDLKEKLADSIPKSKVKEKMEELDKKIRKIENKKVWNEPADTVIRNRLCNYYNALKELMEDK